jgi:hypothetical protein
VPDGVRRRPGRHWDLIPAAAIAVATTAAVCAAQLLPFGQTMLLVRVPGDGTGPALVAASVADAALVGLPAPGFAVVYGDASQVRRALGLAVRWKGTASCSPPP